MELITRIAPTPSGYIHKGNAFNFLLTQHIAEKHNAKILLRIDDSDAQRMRIEYLEDVFQSLEWLGIGWHYGPAGVDDFRSKWSQTLRYDAYTYSLQKLKHKNLLFACTCSRKQLEGYAVYPKTCLGKAISLDEKDVAWRYNMPENALVTFLDFIKGKVSKDVSMHSGCVVLRRRDEIPAYHIVSLTDDENFGVNLIVRGEDLLESSCVQLQLAQDLGLEHFKKTQFHHHPVLQNSAGEKLSKSKGDVSLKFMREQGMKAKELKKDFEVWRGTFT